MKKRRIIQIVVFLIVLSMSIGHSLSESGIHIPLIPSASLHGVCPFGGVVSIYQFFVSGTYVQKIHEASFILMFIVIGISIILGPTFCGWICPFGSFQEWIGSIGRKIFKKKYNTFIPYPVDKYLRFIRYIVLILVVIKTAQSVKLLFADIDPYFALFNIWSDEVAITAYLVLAITIILSLFIERPFCKYMCPYGAFLGIFNLFKIYKIKRIKETCIDCKKCDKGCPMNIPLANAGVSRDHQCIVCMECTSENACPKENTLVLTAKTKHLSSKFVAVISLSFFIIGIGGTMALNLWKTESSKQPAKFTSGDFAGQANPGDIRGSYTLLDIENSFNIQWEDIAKGFGLEGVTEGFKLKELEETYVAPEGFEIGTDSVRLFVAIYNGLPFTPGEGTILPKQSLSVLKEKADLDYIKSFLSDKISYISETTSVVEEHKESISLTGKSIFKDLLDAGYKMDKITNILGKTPKPEDVIKDFCLENGMEFSAFKAKIVEE